MNKKEKLIKKILSFTLAFLILLSSVPLNIVVAEDETVSETVEETTTENPEETQAETVENTDAETEKETIKETVEETQKETIKEETSEETVEETVKENIRELDLELLEFEDLNSNTKTDDLSKNNIFYGGIKVNGTVADKSGERLFAASFQNFKYEVDKLNNKGEVIEKNIKEGNIDFSPSKNKIIFNLSINTNDRNSLMLDKNIYNPEDTDSNTSYSIRFIAIDKDGNSSLLKTQNIRLLEDKLSTILKDDKSALIDNTNNRYHNKRVLELEILNENKFEEGKDYLTVTIDGNTYNLNSKDLPKNFNITKKENKYTLEFYQGDFNVKLNYNNPFQREISSDEIFSNAKTTKEILYDRFTVVGELPSFAATLKVGDQTVKYDTETPVNEDWTYINKSIELVRVDLLKDNKDVKFKYIFADEFSDYEGSIKRRLQYYPDMFSDTMPETPKEKMSVLYIAAIDKFDNVSVLKTAKIYMDDRSPVVVFDKDPLINKNNYITDNVLKLRIRDNYEPSYNGGSGVKDIFYDVKVKDSTGAEVISKKSQLIDNPNNEYKNDLYLDFNIMDIEGIKDVKFGEIEISFYTSDRAGNKSNVLTKSFKFDTLGPKVDIEYLGEEKTLYADNYYDGARTAEVTVTDENPDFSVERFINSVEINRAESVIYRPQDSTKYVTHIESNGNVHKFKIIFNDHGKYNLKFNYKDDADNPVLPFVEKTGQNVRENSTKIEKQNPFEFVIDLIKPAGKIVESQNSWDTFKEIITFGLFKNDRVTFTAVPSNKNFVRVYTGYYIAKNTGIKPLTLAELEQVDFKDGSSVTIKDDGAYVVYFKFFDKWGRKTYINTNGVVIDQQPGNLDLNVVNKGNINSSVEKLDIKYKLEDLKFSSGIKKIEYKILTDNHNDDNPLHKVVVYENDKKTYEKYEDINAEANRIKEGTISIDPKKINRSDIVFKMVAYDFAGNVSSKQIPIDIDTTKPVVDISYTNDSQYKKTNIYTKERKALIKIKERSNHFDEAAAFNSIKIDYKDYNGKDLDFNKDNIGKWTTIKGNTPDEDVHLLEIKFDQDGQYKLSINYKDTHGNAPDSIISVPEQNPLNFKIDLTHPQLEMKYTVNGKQYTVDNETNNGDKFFTKTAVKLDSAKHTNIEDKNIVYKYYFSEALLNARQLKSIYDANDGRMKDKLEEVSVPLNRKGYIYFFVIDNVEKFSFVRTDLIYVDNTKPEINFDSYPEGNKNGIIKTNPKIVISVKDGKTNSSARYSGLSQVYYNLYIDNKLVESKQEVANYNVDDIKYESTETIRLDLTDVESNNIKLEVFAIDNTGNISDNKVALFSKSSKKPKADIRFNDTYTNYEDGEAYYDKARNMEITLYDNDFTFDKDVLVNGLVIKYKDAEGKMHTVPTDDIEVTEITRNYQTINVKLTQQGKYDISMAYINKADNELEPFDVNNISNKDKSTYIYDEHPFSFTIDLDKPTGKIAIRKNPWEDFVEFITFGLISSRNVDVKAIEVKDMTDVKVEYYIDDDFTKYKTDAELDNIKFDFGDTVTINKNSRSVVYFKLIDRVGRVTYLSSNPIIHDNKQPNITITDPGKQIYNGDVKVNISAIDPHLSSGIRRLEYYIINSDIELKDAKPVVIYDKDPVTITDYNNLTTSISKDIVIDAKTHNRSDVKLVVKVVDNAGNENTITKGYDIDITKPAISINYDNNSSYNNSKYFAKARKATIKIQERSNHFDKVVAKNNIKITAVDSKGNSVNISNIIGEWTSRKGSTPDNDTHVIDVNFNVDANYKLFVSYTDMAGNKADTPNTSRQNNPFEFTVDTVKPEGTITSITDEGNKQTWIKKIEDAYFGIWSKSGISATTTSSDSTSGIKSVEYLVSNSTIVMSNQALMQSDAWRPYNGSIRFSNDQKFILYLRVTDRSGNYTLVSTDGMIVDKTDPRIEGISPEVSVSPQKPINGIYKDNVRVDISVLDPIVSNSSTGLKNISYRVLNNGKVTQEGTLFNFTKTKPKYDELTNRFNSYIIVDSNLNNSNNVEIEVFATDNATNSARKSEKIKIDITKPTVIVSYDNNTNYNSKYYNKPRVATVRILERNFDPNSVKINLKNQYGPNPSVSSWSSSGDNGDNTTHIARIYYSADGDYKFDLDFTDNAGNKMNPIVYENGTTNPDSFIVDITNPVVNISYNNNSGIDGYFNNPRTAVIRIVERNFSRENVQITLKSSLDGKTINNPNIVWSSSGDTHFATIAFRKDGDYKLDVKVTDLASNKNGDINYGKSASPKNFTIDQQIDYLNIAGISNNGQYNGEILPIINMSDVNIAGYDLKLFRTNKSGIDQDVTEQYVNNIDKTNKSIKIVIDTLVKSINNEGKYKLFVTVRDKAGNTKTEVMNFIINRYGSIYQISQYLSDLNRNYTQAVENDLVITESNLSKLDKNSIKLTITRDGQALENVDFQILESVDKAGYHNYQYIINKDSLKEDGVYKIFLVSKDKAGNLKENIDSDSMIQFVVDSTAPELVFVKGMEYAFVNSKKLPINFEAFDALGLASVEIYVNDELVDKIDKFDNINQYLGNIELAEGIRQNVRYVIKDKAGNVLDTNYKNNEGKFTFEPRYDFQREITVSTNLFVRWYENKPVFWGSIAGVSVLALLLFLLFKRKKEKDTAQAK